MLQVVIINGSGGFGKDEFVKQVQDYCQSKATVLNISTIDTVKEMAWKYFGASPKLKTDANRNLWSDLKDAWVKYNDGPSREIISICQSHAGKKEATVIFIHCREPEEIEKILCGVNPFAKTHTLLIIRPGYEVPNCSKDLPLNLIETDYDKIICNNTLEGLKLDAINYAQEVLNIV